MFPQLALAIAATALYYRTPAAIREPRATFADTLELPITPSNREAAYYAWKLQTLY